MALAGTATPAPAPGVAHAHRELVRAVRLRKERVLGAGCCAAPSGLERRVAHGAGEGGHAPQRRQLAQRPWLACPAVEHHRCAEGGVAPQRRRDVGNCPHAVHRERQAQLRGQRDLRLEHGKLYVHRAASQPGGGPVEAALADADAAAAALDSVAHVGHPRRFGLGPGRRRCGHVGRAEWVHAKRHQHHYRTAGRVVQPGHALNRVKLVRMRGAHHHCPNALLSGPPQSALYAPAERGQLQVAVRIGKQRSSWAARHSWAAGAPAAARASCCPGPGQGS
mmetsp:Transcript_312/g.1039  ORF Transcript_312/g.1039 Transcript_312/m.1039 type:complete len:279 (-) Transcript_312:71-907(-)